MKKIVFIAYLTLAVCSCGGDDNDTTSNYQQVNDNNDEKPNDGKLTLVGKTFSCSERGAGVGSVNKDSSELVKFKKYAPTSSFAKGTATETVENTMVVISSYDIFEWKLSFISDKECKLEHNTTAHLLRYNATAHKYTFHFEERDFSVGSYPYIESLSASKYTYNDNSFTLSPPYYYNFLYYTDVALESEFDSFDEERSSVIEMTYIVNGEKTIELTNPSNSKTYTATLSGSYLILEFGKNTLNLKQD